MPPRGHATPRRRNGANSARLRRIERRRAIALAIALHATDAGATFGPAGDAFRDS
jgi:hypothetical protein